MEERIGFFTFEQTRRLMTDVGSSRIRAQWLIRHWPEAELYTLGRPYTCLILQKVYWLEGARHFPGIKILDLCDPDFLHWRCPLRQLADLCDAVTTSSEALAEFVRGYTERPVVHIPDRLDLSSFDRPKNHAGNGRTETVAWYGYSSNFEMLNAAIPTLLDLGIRRLIAVASANEPYCLPSNARGRIELIACPWELATVNRRLQEADVILNWKASHGRWKYKSNNKTITARALGLPVAHCPEELAALMSEEARIREAQAGLTEVRAGYDVRQSVSQYRDLISRLRAEKTHCAYVPQVTSAAMAGAECI